MYNATYATRERRPFDENVLINVNMHLNTQITSSAASSYAFCAKHYLGVASYVLRWGLGRVRSLKIVRYEKCMRMSHWERFVT